MDQTDRDVKKDETGVALKAFQNHLEIISKHLKNNWRNRNWEGPFCRLEGSKDTSGKLPVNQVSPQTKIGLFNIKPSFIQ